MIVVDVETTGLNRKKHSIISIGAVDFENPSNTFYIECRPFEGAEKTQEALSVNGATELWLKDEKRPTLEEAFRMFLKWMNNIDHNKELAGSNIKFDIDFLVETAARYGIEWDPGHHPTDLSGWYTDSLDFRQLPVLEHFRTDTIFEYVGLTKEPKPHIAIVGAKMEAEAFARLHGRSLFEEYKAMPIPQYLLNLGKVAGVLRDMEKSMEPRKSTST